MGRAAYSKEVKERVVSRAKEIGVVKAAKENGVSIQSAYRWVNKDKEFGSSESESKSEKPAETVEEPRVRKVGRSTNAKSSIEVENAVLRAENEKLREKISRLKKAILEMI